MTNLDMEIRTMEQRADRLATHIVAVAMEIRRGISDGRLAEFKECDFARNVGAAEGSAVDSEVAGYVGGEEGDFVDADVDAFDAGYASGAGVDVAFELGEDF
jgi:hypothetical protein